MHLSTKFFLLRSNLLALLLICAVVLPIRAQDGQSTKKVTLIGHNITIKSALKTLRQQTGMRFQYEDEILQGQKRRSPNFKDESLSVVLDYIFEGTTITWKFSENGILLRKSEIAAPTSNEGLNNQQPMFQKVSGKVSDAAGETIAGATVRVKGGTKGTTTDADGNFIIDEIALGTRLLVTTMGYEAREVEVRAHTINIIMNLDIRSLDESVIIAYGTTTKRYNTGNVSSVKSADIQKQPVTNALQAIQGRIPGMVITQQTGLPGGGFNVQIRGQNSLRLEGNKPLYIVDGVPYSSALMSGVGSPIIGDGNPLNYLNPADIESIDILKDADATAIYGSRAANGVVLITTKKGISGKTKVDVNFYRGFGKITRKIDLLNAEQYLAMRRETIKNDNAIPDPALDPDLLIWDTTRRTDWQKEMIGGTAQLTDVQASISGGTENIQYLMGAGYHRETTVFPGDFSDQKGNVHFNISARSPNQKFKAMLSASYMADRNNLSNTDFTNNITESPITPEPYKSDGSINWADDTWLNPYARLLSKFKNNTNNLITSSVLSYELLPGLELKGSMGYNSLQIREIATNPMAALSPAYGPGTGSASFADNSVSSWIFEPQIDYRKNLGKGKLSVLLGMTIQQSRNAGTILNSSGVTDDALLESIISATDITVLSQDNILYKYNAVFARINYNFLDRYLINLTGRRDGSSRFGPGRQFANFGAVGLAWIFSEEDFAKKALRFLSFGKLRGSYGTSGNDQISDYGYLTLYNANRYPYQGAPGIFPNNLSNPDFAWEVNKKLEFGLELGLFKDRVILNTSYFRNRSSNQLVGNSLAPSTGFTSVLANLPAKVQNSGWEVVLESRNITSGKFTWSTSVNLSILRNKLLEYPGLENSNYRYVYVVGQPLTVLSLYNSNGVDPETGQYIFFDSKGSPTLNPDFTTDRTVLINTAPKYFGGLQNSFQYKGFQLDVLLQFVKQIGRNYKLGSYPGTININQPINVLDRWQQPGDHSQIQRFNGDYSIYQSFDFATLSNLSYSDASFIRLKNIALSWQLPKHIQKRMSLQNARIFLQGQNVLTFTDYIGLDPENQTFANLPPLSVWTIGFQLTL